MKEYITVKEAVEKWGASLMAVQALCAEVRIEGASKMANVWVIPEDTEYPEDGRIKNGKYINWRKNRKR